MTKVAIIGGGAAGLLAGIAAAQNGAQVTIFEKMRLPGKKIMITGKGRCNITNACEIPEFIKNIPGNGRFLNSAFYFFYPDYIFLLARSLAFNGSTVVCYKISFFRIQAFALSWIYSTLTEFRNYA